MFLMYIRKQNYGKKTLFEIDLTSSYSYLPLSLTVAVLMQC